MLKHLLRNDSSSGEKKNKRDTRRSAAFQEKRNFLPAQNCEL